MSSATPPAIVSTAAPTIARGSILRYLSRSGSSTHDASGSPSWSGRAAPPVPTITLAIRSGCAAAANRAAEVPTSGATMCGLPRSASAMSWARNSPIARGDRRFSRRSDAPNPGRSTANRRACSASVAQIGANAYRLSGQGLVSSIAGSCAPPLAAYRILSPSIVRNCGLIDVFNKVFMETPWLPVKVLQRWRLFGKAGAREVCTAPRASPESQRQLLSQAIVKGLCVPLLGAAREARRLGRRTIPLVDGHFRIHADRPCRSDGTGARITDDTVERAWRFAVLDPVHELAQRIPRLRPWSALAVVHAWREEQPSEIVRIVFAAHRLLHALVVVDGSLREN